MKLVTGSLRRIAALLAVLGLVGCAPLAGQSGQGSSQAAAVSADQVQAASQVLTQSVTGLETAIQTLSAQNPEQAATLTAATAPALSNLKTAVANYQTAATAKDSNSSSSTEVLWSVAKGAMGLVIEGAASAVGKAAVTAVGL